MYARLFPSQPSYHNPYDSEKMALYYDRPSILYQEIFERVRNTLGIEKPVALALDVGCGTGISSHALKAVANQIIGIDASEGMLKYAKSDACITYQKAFAENLPFEDKQFDLVAVCVAFHLVNKAQFLKEAARVLKDSGQLIICYTNFTGLKTKEYDAWIKQSLYSKYPPTPAVRNVFPKELLNDAFPDIAETRYPVTTEVSIKNLAQLIMTMSGVCETAEKTGEDPREIEAWLLNELKPFFVDKDRVPFQWNISIWTLQRAPRLENSCSFRAAF